MTDQALQTTTTGPSPVLYGKDHEDELSLALDTERFDQMSRIASMMADGSLLPDHLVVRPYWCPSGKGEIHASVHKQAIKDLGTEEHRRSLEVAERRTMANCFRVVNQAFRWRMDPFSIIDKTYSVGDGKLSYEGQLVAAVVNTRGGLKGRLSYRYEGEPYTDERTIFVSGTFLDEEEPREVDLSVGQAKTKNDIWRKDPDQKLVYSGVTKWARRYCPELMLGVLTHDDLERMQTKVIEVSASVAPPSVAATIAAGTPAEDEIQYEPAPAEDQNQEPRVEAEDESQEAPADLGVAYESARRSLEKEAKNLGVKWSDFLGVAGQPETWEGSLDTLRGQLQGLAENCTREQWDELLKLAGGDETGLVDRVGPFPRIFVNGMDWPGARRAARRVGK